MIHWAWKSWLAGSIDHWAGRIIGGQDERKMFDQAVVSAVHKPRPAD